MPRRLGVLFYLGIALALLPLTLTAQAPCRLGINLQHDPLSPDSAARAETHYLLPQLPTLQAAGISALRFTLTPPGLAATTLPRETDSLLCALARRGMQLTLCLPLPAEPAELLPLLSLPLATPQGGERTVLAASSALEGWQLLLPAPATAAEADSLVQRTARTAQFLRQHTPTGRIGLCFAAESDSLLLSSLYERLHAHEAIAYLSLTLSPVARGAVSPSSLYQGLSHAYVYTRRLLTPLQRLAQRYEKPLVVNALAYPRDKGFVLPSSATQCRDAYFAFVLSQSAPRAFPALSVVYLDHWATHTETVAPKAPAGETFPPRRTYAIYATDSTTLHSPAAQ